MKRLQALLGCKTGQGTSAADRLVSRLKKQYGGDAAQRRRFRRASDGGGRIRTATPTKDLIISLLQRNWHLLPDYIKTIILILLESTTSTATKNPQQYTLSPWIAHDDDSPIQRRLCQHQLHDLTGMYLSNLGRSSSPGRCQVFWNNHPQQI